MKVLILNTSYKTSYYHKLGEVAYPPLGIAYISATLKKNSIPHIFYDIFLEENYKENLKNTILDNEDIKYIYISGYLNSFKFQQDISAYIKKINDKIIIISGGGLASAVSDYLLLNTDVKIAVIGEVEVCLPELVLKLEHGDKLSEIDGIVYKETDGSINRTKKREQIKYLDLLPYPNYDIFDMDKYSSYGNVVSISTARGCIGNCSFCYKLFNGVRFRSIENVIRELEELKEKLNFEYLKIFDDNFLVNRDRVKVFCEYFKKNNIKWNCTSRVDFADYELLKLCKDSGCTTISFGLESADERVLNRMNKKINISKAKKVIDICNEIGLDTTINLIFGYIDEDADSFEKTLNFASSLNLSYPPPISWFVPYPGTEDFLHLQKEHNFSLEKHLNRISEGRIYNYTKLKNEELTQYYIKFANMQKKFMNNIELDKKFGKTVHKCTIW